MWLLLIVEGRVPILSAIAVRLVLRHPKHRLLAIVHEHCVFILKFWLMTIPDGRHVSVLSRRWPHVVRVLFDCGNREPRAYQSHVRRLLHHMMSHGRLATWVGHV